MKRYKVDAVVEGNSENEVASKLMVAAYTQEFEIETLDVSLIEGEIEEYWLAEATEPVPEDNLPGEPFHFPHVSTLIDGLQKLKKERDANNS